MKTYCLGLRMIYWSPSSELLTLAEVCIPPHNEHILFATTATPDTRHSVDTVYSHLMSVQDNNSHIAESQLLVV